MAAKGDKNGKQGVADRAIAAAKAALRREEEDAPHSPSITLTEAELQDLDLLCYILGAGKNACISFATKYFCSLFLHSTVQVRLPREQKPSAGNPLRTVEYGLNPEVTAAVKAARAKSDLLRSRNEGDIVKLGVLYICKKLLPSKRQRAVTVAAS
jgi:hypothetical protein